MSNPAALSIPALFAAVALLAFIVLALHQDGGLTALQPPRQEHNGRHRLENAAAPRPVRYGVLDPQVPLAEVEEYLRCIGAADQHRTLTAPELSLAS